MTTYCAFLLLVPPALLVLPAAAVVSPRQAANKPATTNYESYWMESTIVSRYATVRVTSVVFNSNTVAREFSFQVQLPEKALISGFNM